MNLSGRVAQAWKRLTRADRHEFEVVRKFSARSAISDTERIFYPGEKVICADPAVSTVTLETGGAFFLVDSATFHECCKALSQGATHP